MLDRSRGIKRLVDAQPIRDHVQMLLDSGMSFRAIVLTAGWNSRHSLVTVLGNKKVTPSTLARVLAVQPISDQRGDRYVDATGTRRRLQALARLGWSARAIAKRLGRMDPNTYVLIRAGRTTTVRGRTVDDVRRLYDELWDQQGPSERTRRWAAEQRYALPMEWDDDEIDDPTAKPRRFVKKGRGVQLEDVEFLLGMGETMQAIAHRLGVSRDAIDQILHRAQAS